MRRFAPTTLFLLCPGIALCVPEGFVIKPYAGPPQVEYPTAVSAAANGDIYVSQDKNASLGHAKDFGKIVCASDTDGDGKADKFVDFVPNVNSPRGGHMVGGTFYLIHPPYLTSYRDTNGDGVSDEEKTLVTGFGWGIEHPRGADHTTNGVRMGIDGWLYVAVGDFGMPNAKSADGTTMTLHGGGVVRVRPDGSDMELYASMVRNICDIAITPTLDMFSRDNTNDGKGWNTRFHHYTQLGNHGYPRLYQSFADEAIKPLADYGGGSGTGGLALDEPGFPGDFGKAIYTCDWTTGNVYFHPMKPFEASFVAKQQVFEKLPRAIDIDVDGFSRLYLADWRGGGYTYSGPGKPVGQISLVTATDRSKAAKYTDVTKAQDAELPVLLGSASGVQRLEAQREILKRGKKPVFAHNILALAKNANAPLAARVAAIFTLKQLYGKDSHKPFIELAADATVKEFALRALADRKKELDGVPVQLFVDALKDENPRVRLQALIGLTRLQAKAAAPAILAAAGTWPTDESKLEAGAHYRLPHTAMQALAELGNAEACLAALGNPEQRPLALRALQLMHTAPSVDGLIRIAAETQDDDVRFGALSALARLYFDEKPWDLQSWWNTRPDDRGPYFEPVAWEATPRIKAAIETSFTKLSKGKHSAYIELLAKNRIPVSDLKLAGVDPLMIALGAPQPDAGQIALLSEAAKDAKREWEQRVAAYNCLKRAPAKQITPLRLNVLAAWAEEKNAPGASAQLIDDFVNETQRGEEIAVLRDIAAKSSDAISRIAWKSILTVLNSPLAKEPWKAAAKKAIESNPREIGFFNAITDLKLKGYDAQIEVGLNSDNRLLIESAQAARAATQTSAKEGKKVAELPPAEVRQAALTAKGDVATGKRLFVQQGCIACHAIDAAAEQKGPYLGAAGAKFSRDYLIDSVLDPNKDVAQGFQTTLLTLKDKSSKMGFITGEADGVIEVRDITGATSKINRADVASEQHLPTSMMPPGLASGLSVEEFNALIEYLVSLRAVGG